jgi:PA domain-containing protein
LLALPADGQLAGLAGALRAALGSASLSPAEEAKLRFQLGRLLATMNEVGASRAELERAVAGLPPGSLQAARAMTLLGWPQGGDCPAREHLRWLRRAAEMADSVPPAERLRLLVDRATALLLLGEEAGWAEAARVPWDAPAPGERLQVTRSHINIGEAALMWGRYGEARRRLEHAAELAGSYHYTRLRDGALTALAHLDWLTGAWDGSGLVPGDPRGSQPRARPGRSPVRRGGRRLAGAAPPIRRAAGQRAPGPLPARRRQTRGRPGAAIRLASRFVPPGCSGRRRPGGPDEVMSSRMLPDGDYSTSVLEDLFSQGVSNWWAVPTPPGDQATIGGYHFSPAQTLGANEVTAAVTAPTHLVLHPLYPCDSDTLPDSLCNVARFPGRQTLQLVNAGYGTASDFSKIDARGKLALISTVPTCLIPGLPDCAAPDQVLPEQLADAQQAGAAGVLIDAGTDPNGYPNDLPAVVNTTGNLYPPAHFPFAEIDAAEGSALLSLLAKGQVTVMISDSGETPYAYFLRFDQEALIPASLHYTLTSRQLGENQLLSCRVPAAGRHPGVGHRVPARRWHWRERRAGLPPPPEHARLLRAAVPQPRLAAGSRHSLQQRRVRRIQSLRPARRQHAGLE